MRDWVTPQLPQAFWGEVFVGGQPAPVGTVVEGREREQGARVPADHNPLTLTEAGKLGGSGGFDPKLVVQGDFRKDGSGPIPVGAPIYFVVSGEVAWILTDAGIWTQNIPFQPGEVTHILLAR